MICVCILRRLPVASHWNLGRDICGPHAGPVFSLGEAAPLSCGRLRLGLIETAATKTGCDSLIPISRGSDRPEKLKPVITRWHRALPRSALFR